LKQAGGHHAAAFWPVLLKVCMPQVHLMSFHHQQVSPQNSSACQNADEAKIAITYGFLRIFPLENKIGLETTFI
jgi:hypothetical protein